MEDRSKIIESTMFEAARLRIAPFVHETPVLESKAINSLVGAEVFFKCEHLQVTGSFKYRGATNAVQSLSVAEAEHGVATHSSGNHGSALARAAQCRGVPATVVVPDNANKLKVAAIQTYGGRVVFCPPTLDDREAMLASVITETGAMFIPPYDDKRIIAGQGTMGLELMGQVNGMDAVVAPVGGGGMLAGIASVMSRSSKVFGAEPAIADDARRSFHSGTRVTSMQTNTIADGLRTTLGEINFHIIRREVNDILTVSEAQIVAAMKVIWTRLKQVVEPSASVPLAVVMAYPDVFRGQRIGIILSGGNIDPDHLPY